jgi:hypothetical protein
MSKPQKRNTSDQRAKLIQQSLKNVTSPKVTDLKKPLLTFTADKALKKPGKY